MKKFNTWDVRAIRVSIILEKVVITKTHHVMQRQLLWAACTVQCTKLLQKELEVRYILIGASVSEPHMCMYIWYRYIIRPMHMCVPHLDKTCVIHDDHTHVVSRQIVCD